MVYCGKPSKGCEYCRKRKIKCDQKRPACSQCTRAKQPCAGYRDPIALMFRNESDSVVRKALQKKAPKKGPDDRGRSASPTRYSVEPVEEIIALSTEIAVYDPPSLDGTAHIFRNLMPHVKDLAVPFFFHNFVVCDSDTSKGHMDDLPHLSMTSGVELSAAISSVGMACFANINSSSDVMVTARQEYANAVRLTNLALQDPVQSKRDGLLMTVMLLAMFETTTCTAPQSMQAWTNHVEGAGALLRIRGLEQFRRRTGLNLFFQLRHQILISAIQREVYIPHAVFELSKLVEELESPDEACASGLTDIIILFTNLRASIRDGSNTDSLSIVTSLLAMEADLAAWILTIPSSWMNTVKSSPDDTNTYEGYYHVYPDIWTASMWNNYRSVRVLVNELLLIHLGRISSSSYDYDPLTGLSTYMQGARTIIHQLCLDICASVPFYLGNVSVSSYPTASTKRSLGGFQIMWPLFVCGSMTWTGRRMQDWVITQLEGIGYTMGVQQAIPLAEMIRRNGSLLEWSKGGNESDWADCVVSETGMVYHGGVWNHVGEMRDSNLRNGVRELFSEPFERVL